MKNKGIGYIDYKKMRINEGIMPSKIENGGNERYVIYLMRSHMSDHETSTFCRGHAKIGRAKFATALLRGRNQSGVDNRIYAEIQVSTNEETHRLEKIAQSMLANRNLKFSQGQEEMYDIKDNEIVDIFNQIVDTARNQFLPINVLEVKFY